MRTAPRLALGVAVPLVVAATAAPQSAQVLTLSRRLTAASHPVNCSNTTSSGIFNELSVLNPALWFETHDNVSLNGGNFAVNLGNDELNPLPASPFHGSDRALQMIIDPGTLSERVTTPWRRLGSAGNAFRADNAEHAAATDLAFGVDPNTVGSAEIVDGSTPFEDIGGNGAPLGDVTKWNQGAGLPNPTKRTPLGRQLVQPNATSTTPRGESAFAGTTLRAPSGSEAP